ncbi:MAG TPA: hypothetical protein VEV16_11415 [Daejeonella sp.]|nr:hypothetical protein [Daejeonella sp.]
MKDFKIILQNKGRSLTGNVTYIFPNEFSVDIHDLKLNLKLTRNSSGKLECAEFSGITSNLISDLCDLIDARMKESDK